MNNMPIGISRTVSAVAILSLLCWSVASSEHSAVYHITKHLRTFTEVWDEAASLHRVMQNVINNILKKVTCLQQCSEDQTHLCAEFTGLA
jgi:hypothetical protein